MKRLLILTDFVGPKKELFAEGIAKRMPIGFQVSLARFSDLVFGVDGKNVSIRIDGIGKEITDFDLVYYRRAGDKFLSLAGTLAVCLNCLKVRFFDTTFANIGPAGDKFTSYLRLSLAGLPVVPAYFCWHTKVLERKNEIIGALGLPLVAKQLSSQRGKGVVLVKKEEDLESLLNEFPEEEFMFQKYYKSKEEYRILVLKSTIGAYEAKISQKGEWRGNVALGAKEKFLNVKKIPENFKKIAIVAAKTLNIQIAGVDILVDEVGRVWLLEVNRGPGITYDDKISPEITNLAKFFAQELRKS